MIALIITIIVLLILAGVSIATLTGDNGLLTKANSVKTRTEEAQIEEEIILAYNLMQMKEGTTEEKLAIMREELQRQDLSVTITRDNQRLKGIYKGYNFSIENGKVAFTSDEVIGTREDWEISDDGKLKLYKGAVPGNGTIVTPTYVDGVKVKYIDAWPRSLFYNEADRGMER